MQGATPEYFSLSFLLFSGSVDSLHTQGRYYAYSVVYSFLLIVNDAFAAPMSRAVVLLPFLSSTHFT